MRKKEIVSSQRKNRAGRPASFGNVQLDYVNAEVPAELLKSFRVLVATRRSRLNRELALALKMYLKKHARLSNLQGF